MAMISSNELVPLRSQNIDNVNSTSSQLTELQIKKQLGIFYTTGDILGVLCDWGIRSSEDNALEPSFGGCGFLDASLQRLLSLGCPAPSMQVSGCDIDAQAFEHLSSLLGIGETPNRFYKRDFLQLGPEDFVDTKFHVVIGNPPYVSHHNMTADQRKSASVIADRYGMENRKASLWAYFVRHSLSFLQSSGRMAWILPVSFLHAEYAQELRNLLRAYFKRCLAVQIGDRLFLEEGTEEQVVVLLCEDYGTPIEDGGFRFAYSQNTTCVSELISAWTNGVAVGSEIPSRPNMALLREAGCLYKALEAKSHSLGDFLSAG